MGFQIEYISGQTPLDDDEREGLKIETITTRGELDQLEEQNIQTAQLWFQKQRVMKSEVVLTEHFVTALHKRMYGGVWRWAGKFRKTEKNIGIKAYEIPVALSYLLQDAQYWIQNNTFPPDEIAIRVKHRIVAIHCFPNGNGRHSRMLGDILNEKVFGGIPFTWGAANLAHAGKPREAYLRAVKAGDRNDFRVLLDFARS